MRIFTRFILLTACGLASAQAGGSAVDRQEFKQSQTYPYVFRPVCYLATSGPVPLRFVVSPPDCGDRNAPKLPPAAKNTPKPVDPADALTAPPTLPVAATAPAPAPVPAPTSSSTPPAYPPPTNAPAPKPSSVDFAQFPADLVEAFKKGRDSSETRNYLFDPIFQPALPDDLPKSKATYKEK